MSVNMTNNLCKKFISSISTKISNKIPIKSLASLYTSTKSKEIGDGCHTIFYEGFFVKRTTCALTAIRFALFCFLKASRATREHG